MAPCQTMSGLSNVTQERSHTTNSPKRPRTFSQHSAPPLHTRSLSSTMESPNIPFSPRGPIAPLETNNHPMFNNWFHQCNDPANVSLMIQPRSLSTRRQSYLGSLAEDAAAPASLDVGMDIGDYIATMGESLESPAMIPPQQSTFLSPNDFPPHRASFQGQVSSACPSMVSAPSTAETVSLMERNRSCSDASISAAEMARIVSSTSQQTDSYNSQEMNYNLSRFSPFKRGAGDELVFVGAGFNQYASSAPTEAIFSQHSTAMERSISTTSAKSNSSACRRAKEAHQRHIENSKRVSLAPKPVDVNKPRHSAEAEAAKKSGKRPLSKAKYQRPQHPKVHCNQCKDRPDGFRGEHELRRHTLAKHEGIVKKYRCCDPAKAGIKPTVAIINPLSKCKQCNTGKLYGAYYNAAAHLRRTHFKPKTSRGKRKTEEDEKRGGSGGGDWPSMSELKFWFEEVSVDVTTQDPSELDHAEEEDPLPDSSEIGSTSFLVGGFDDYESQSFNSLSELSVDTSCSGAMVMPISSASSGFDFAFSPMSPLSGMQIEYEPASSIYGGSAISSNTLTPTNYQLSHISDEYGLQMET